MTGWVTHLVPSLVQNIVNFAPFLKLLPKHAIEE